MAELCGEGELCRGGERPDGRTYLGLQAHLHINVACAGFFLGQNN